MEAHFPYTGGFVRFMNTAGKNDDVEFIQADGHELEAIGRYFPNLPRSFSSCIWRGEMARFIAENHPFEF